MEPRHRTGQDYRISNHLWCGDRSFGPNTRHCRRRSDVDIRSSRRNGNHSILPIHLRGIWSWFHDSVLNNLLLKSLPRFVPRQNSFEALHLGASSLESSFNGMSCAVPDALIWMDYTVAGL
ncbi:hypothetical protein F4809DRAFT_635204 [Biscogniauxia mediterranea]|nr:hypothetical protein F4809DRAFT_635204 [Biscogniauxia mediterranea]